MKPNQIKNRKLNLNKQTIQKLDSQKLVTVYAGEQEAGTSYTYVSAAGVIVAAAASGSSTSIVEIALICDVAARS